MHRLRCFAHATVTATALVAWAAVVFLIVEHPTANDGWRLPFFAVLGIAVGASSLSLFPVVIFGYLERSRRLRDTRGIAEAFYWWGRADERDQLESTARARLSVVRAVNDDA